MATQGLSVPEQYCLNLVPSSRRRSILDIGVGCGRTTGPLSEMFQKYTGIDYSEGMIFAARSLFTNADLRTMDARDLKFAEQFDCIMFSFNGIDSVEYADRRLIFQQMVAALQPGGYLIYSTHNIHNPRVDVWLTHFFVRELFQAWPHIIRIVRSGLNRLTRYWRQSHDRNKSFACVNDCGGDFGYLNTYVDINKELDSIVRRNGFKVIATIGDTKMTGGYGPDDSWVYIVVQSSACA
jgi:SAM-dependent methyltransferase